VLTSALLFGVPLVFLVFMRRFEARQSVQIGILAMILAGLLFAFFPHPTVPFIAKAILGVTIFFFWMPFNILYYEGAKKKGKGNTAFISSVYYSIVPILSLALPALAGWTAASLGFPALFLISVALLLVNLAMAGRFIEPKRYSYDAAASLRSISGLRTLFFIEGFSLMSITQVTLSAMILLFYTDPQGFGGMLSAVTVFSVIASFVTARLSDHYGERRTFIIASAFCFLLSAVFTNFANTAALFFLGFGAISFFRGILLPLPLALAVDRSKNLVDTMIGREIMLDLGRTAAILIGFALVVYFDIRAMLILQTFTAALYIPVFELKKKKLLAEKKLLRERETIAKKEKLLKKRKILQA
jgi:MFS family permease